MDNLIGKKLDGRYLIESLIGVGGMANVYKGRDVRTNNAIAVKVLKEEFLGNEELVRRFKNESKAISILDHPNIVKVYDVSVTDQLQYIVMEYIDGITLKEYLKQRGGALTWKEVVHFATQVLGALDHAHSKGIVHREQFNEIPPHVEYSFTERGRDLMPIFYQIMLWGFKHEKDNLPQSNAPQSKPEP